MQDRSVVVGEHTIKGAVNRSSSLNPRAIEYRHAGLGNHQIALFNSSQQRSKPVDLYPREYDGHAFFSFMTLFTPLTRKAKADCTRKLQS